MKKKILLLFYFLNIYTILHAQEKKSKGLAVTLTPRYFYLNGIRMDIEFIDNEKSNSFLFSPQIYLKYHDTISSNPSINQMNSEFDNLIGYGGGVFFIHHFTDSPLLSSHLFFTSGAQYIYFYRTFKDYTWIQKQENGLKILKYELSNGKEKIQSMDGSFAFGYRFIESVFTFDLYLGTGLKYGFLNTTYHRTRDENNNNSYWDNGYKGVYPLVGFRFGLIFKD